MRIERCKDCGAVHEHVVDTGNLTLFVYRHLAKCTVCGVEKERDSIEEEIRVCDACKEPFIDDEESLSVSVQQSMYVRIHPRCLQNVFAALKPTLKKGVEDNRRYRIKGCSSWLDDIEPPPTQVAVPVPAPTQETTLVPTPVSIAEEAVEATKQITKRERRRTRHTAISSIVAVVGMIGVVSVPGAQWWIAWVTCVILIGVLIIGALKK